jgi:glutathione synthase/RimK-type ligase-like ATP-grasp enzyme
MILILSGAADIHADAVEAELCALGVECVRFDGSLFPDQAVLSISLDDSGALGGTLVFDQVELSLDAVQAIWVRRPGTPICRNNGLGNAARATAEADAAATLSDLWTLMEVPCIPATAHVIAQATHKATQLRRAAQMGFTIPPTFIGNDPDTFLEAVKTDPSAFITKRCAPSQRLLDEQGGIVSRLTEPLRPKDLVHVDAWRHSPMTVQSTVPKDVELRVTVVGDEVFAAAILSQSTNHSRHDWRRLDLQHTSIEAYALPPEIAARCVALVNSLGLSYGAIDLIVTPDSQTVFLEVNPNGQYLWIEETTGMPISGAMARLLSDRATSNQRLRACVSQRIA